MNDGGSQGWAQLGGEADKACELGEPRAARNEDQVEDEGVEDI